MDLSVCLGALGGGGRIEPPREADEDGGGGKLKDARLPVALGGEEVSRGRFRLPNLEPPKLTVMVSPSLRL